MKIKALLVGVCGYTKLNVVSLPLCENDVYAVESALINGLKVKPEDITICGNNGHVTVNELKNSLSSALSDATNDDTFIFYFTGHGGKNILALSDDTINLQILIDEIESTITKNKIIILDSCHSGGFNLKGHAQIDIFETVESFAGRGYAVLASCGSEQTSGFNNNRNISLYTSFLCDALTNRYLIKEGRKSLESINHAIFQYAKVLKSKNMSKVQDPIFRSSIGGTIFFDVEEYKPYETKQYYEETEQYIIYSVDPVHHGIAKRLTAKVILRYESSKEEIASIANEINHKIKYYDVYKNEISEKRHKGNPANIIWCYFGYDEDDMVDPNYLCHSTWIDDKQDKNNWYRGGKNSEWVKGIYLQVNPSYSMLKKIMHDDDITKEDFIEKVKAISASLITLGEKLIRIFREYRNNTLSEKQLVDSIKPLNNKILKLYMELTNLPVSPIELHDWFQSHIQIASTIQDLTLFYDEKNLDIWTDENKVHLAESAINRYGEELEKLIKHDKLI